MAYKVIISKETTEYWSDAEMLDYINKNIELKNGEEVTSIIPISENEYKSAKDEVEEGEGVTLVCEDEEGEEHTITVPNTHDNFSLLLQCCKNNRNPLNFVRLLGGTLYEDGTRIDFENDSFICCLEN